MVIHGGPMAAACPGRLDLCFSRAAAIPWLPEKMALFLQCGHPSAMEHCYQGMLMNQSLLEPPKGQPRRDSQGGYTGGSLPGTCKRRWK